MVLVKLESFEALMLSLFLIAGAIQYDDRRQVRSVITMLMFVSFALHTILSNY
jgi:hypothetical protein